MDQDNPLPFQRRAAITEVDAAGVPGVKAGSTSVEHTLARLPPWGREAAVHVQAARPKTAAPFVDGF